MHKILIIIPTYGRSTLLERTLTSLAACEFPSNYVKTIVVENGSKESAETICERFSKIRVNYQYFKNANKSAALNYVLNQLNDEHYLIFFDDDIRIAPNTIEAYAKAFETKGAEYFYGGPFGVDYDQEPAKYYKKFLPASARGWILPPDVTPSPYLMGFNWAVHSSHLNSLGGFDERFGPNSTTGATGQEHDMMLKLDKASIKPAYVADAMVWHYVPRSRSTLRWALMRKYKNGLSDGVRNPDWDDRSIRTKTSRTYRSLLSAFVKLEKDRFLEQVFMLNYLRGVKEGLKIGRNS